ncbi:LacI family transcriptional regulator [Herbihabitans rhizosphaerae]|uniref:LacI family transcriptional regulator n=1 Tax=Herbihabitans rhizosphaerae TaxID=1872711 RepID=A0A4Q7KLE1_9PSEU|nr:LacI family transcriptional regulator [Herbihabitans rhizosphaerae]
MVRMRDVAQLASVSVTTVSHVINKTRAVDPETRARVLDAIARTGYRKNSIALALAKGGTQSVGVALSALSNPYFAELVTAIEARVSELGSTLLLGETHEDAEREYDLVTKLLDRRVDGVVLAPTANGTDTALDALVRSGVPAVLVDRLVAPDRFDQVGSDNREPVATLVDHLVGHGHRRIGYVAGRSGLATSIERRQGYDDGLTRNGIAPDPALVVDGGSDGTLAGQAMRRLWELTSRPTAVITGNNYMTVGVLRHLEHAGIVVPDDLALCGFDDFEWAELMRSPLTAIAQDWTAIGTTAVGMLRDRLAEPDRPFETVRIPATLIVRRSCGCSG